MVWYVAVIAVLNLGLGYFLAVYLGAGRAQIEVAMGDLLDDSEYADSETSA
jgi:hypothetical protein